MKRRMLLINSVVAMLLVIFALAAFADTDIDQHRDCKYCGMDRKAYGYSRMLILYQDGGQTGVCSLNCAVTELETNKGRQVKSMLVADRDTRLLIDSGKAIWVIGGKKRGVMTQNPKWAFADRKDADAFIKQYGGKPATFDDAFKATEKELADEAQRDTSREHKGHEDNKM